MSGGAQTAGQLPSSLPVLGAGGPINPNLRKLGKEPRSVGEGYARDQDRRELGKETRSVSEGYASKTNEESAEPAQARFDIATASGSLRSLAKQISRQKNRRGR